MRDEQEIYQDISQILLNTSPDDAVKIIVRAKPFPKGDGGEYEFDYIDSTDENSWFDPYDGVVSDLTPLMVELREYYLYQGFTIGLPVWVHCEMTLDLEKMKLSIEFEYDSPES
ncbi:MULTISPECIES: hypothetical protein [Yersinia pseudotuberculosis complex]|uniref:Uncharacterized protein n=1 Tax=Yersinia wautersii TaxID=1341643 RepID=A0ABM9TKZ1_9GAMM|nr:MULTISPECIES: hypothetical protein [Yersinia pseudotuberculosis complex]CNC93372.1 Uncharacterised protein [Yersinia pseudotuberculosis]CRG52713.1 Uncharacterised protein [Yersinia wautersii]